MKGAAPASLDSAKALAAWQLLFMVVPVVSTTFASCGRMFRQLGAESLGWLLIDEAGQAAPQQAVGAIWRSKRVVVVGDPMQLPPVVTIPFKTQDTIRLSHQVTEQWLPSRTSVQRLVDALTPVGTTVALADEQLWVGAPLRVHRRCDEPMFGIVNSIAYEGQMVNGLGPRPDLTFADTPAPLPPTCWIDVVGDASDGHAVAAEHEVLDQVLRSLEDHGQPLANVFVVTPFRDVARQFENRLPWRWRKVITSGTIHTAQGKEADIVILVLGSDPARQNAREWATRPPNLINVAVSRARRRLYVIGNRQLWLGCGCMRALDRLPRLTSWPLE